MRKAILNLVMTVFSVSNNPVYNFVAISLAAIVIFPLTYYIVGMNDLNGRIGSIAYAFISIFLFYVFASLVAEIMKYWLVICIMLVLVLTAYIIKLCLNERY